jgi:hypothetical protein
MRGDEDGASHPYLKKIDEICHVATRVNRKTSRNSIYSLFAKILAEQSGGKKSLTEDGVRRQFERGTPSEELKNIAEETHQRTVIEGIPLILDPAIPKGDYLVEHIEPTVKELLKIYGSYSKLGIAANMLTCGAVKTATIESLSKTGKTRCTKPIGDALMALSAISKLSQGMRADRRIFKGARVIDERGNKLTVEDIINGCVILDDGKTARIGYPAESILERIAKPSDDPANPTPAQIKRMRDDLAQLRITYKTDMKIAQTIHLLLDGAVNLDTRVAEAELDEAKCCEEVGDQLRLMEKVSRFDHRFAHNDVFLGAMLRDYSDKTYAVTDVRDYQVVLDGNYVVPLKYSARDLNRQLAELKPEMYRMTLEKLRALIIEAVHYDKIRFDRSIWQKAFAGEDVSIHKKAKFIAERMKRPLLYNPKYRYEINDIMRDKGDQEVVVAHKDGFITTVDHRGATHLYLNGSASLQR